jgi:hypothetical protein
VAKRARGARPNRRSAAGTPARTTPTRKTGRAAPKTSARVPKWTVMVYMAAELDPELDAHAVRDLQEMERATISADVRVIVQINRHWPTFPQRYKISKGVATVTDPNVRRIDSGDPATLSDFINEALQADLANDSPETDRKYLLVLWGHAYGLGFGRDHGDPLLLAELRKALGDFKKARPGGGALELLGANACAMSYAEAACELRGVATCLVASQIAVPYAGWPYQSILTLIKGASSVEEVGRLIVDRYVAAFSASRAGEQVAMTLIDLTVASRLQALIKKLTSALVAVVNGPTSGASDRLAHVRAAFLSTAVGDVRPLIDLGDLCRQLLTLCTDLVALQPGIGEIGQLSEAAGRLLTFLQPAAGLPPRLPAVGTGNGAFVLMHKQHDELRGLNGVGVFAPFVSDAADLRRLGLEDEQVSLTRARRTRRPPSTQPRSVTDAPAGRKEYQRLKLPSATGWDTLVYDTLRSGLPSDTLSSVESAGATDRADRGAVTQMLVAVDSTFDVLDRRIAAARAGMSRFLEDDALSLAARPAEFLRLELLEHKKVHEAVEKGIAAQGGQPAPSAFVAVKAGGHFKELEDMIRHVERAVRRTLTNGTFGLGPGPLALPSSARLPRSQGKGAGGEGAPRDKGAGGEGLSFDKGAGTQGPPPANGEIGGGNAVPSFDITASTATLVTTGLFREVGQSMVRLESAVGEAETAAAVAVASGAAAVGEGAPTSMRIRRAFRQLSDASTDARRTLKRVLAHPVYGFGLGPDDVGSEDRREIARTAGLSSVLLKLI